MRFRILGPVEVQVDGGWSSISAPKGRTVLAVLLLRSGEVVSIDQLIDDVTSKVHDAAAEELATAGMTGITCLIHQNLVPG